MFVLICACYLLENKQISYILKYLILRPQYGGEGRRGGGTYCAYASWCSAPCCSSHPPPPNSHTGGKWDKRRRQLELFFWGGGIYCSQATGGLTVEKPGQLHANEDTWMTCFQLECFKTLEEMDRFSSVLLWIFEKGEFITCSFSFV